MKKIDRHTILRILRLTVVAAVVLGVFLLCGCGGNPYSDEVDPDWTIDVLNVDITVHDDRTAAVTEEFTVTFNAYNKHGIIRDFAVNSGEKYRDITVTDKNGRTVPHTFERENGLLSVRTGTEYKTYGPSDTVFYKIEYTIIPPTKAKGAYYMNAIGPAFSTRIKQANISITMPSEIDRDKAFFYRGKYGENVSLGVTPMFTGERTVHLDNLSLDPYEGIAFDITVSAGVFRARVDWGIFGTLFVGLAIIAVAVALKLTVGKSKPIVAITEYYPPEVDGKRLSPVRLGYLIDNTCENGDVTSLVFYWASLGLLTLDDMDGDPEITIVKPLPPDAPAYEHTMFDKLYALASPKISADGDGKAEQDAYIKSVAVSALSEKFYPAVTAVKQGVASEYRGRLYRGSARAVSALMAFAAAVFAVGAIFLRYLRIAADYFNFLAFAAAIPVVVIYVIGYYIANHYLKFDRKKRTAALVGYIFGACLLAGIPIAFVSPAAMGITEKILLAVGTAAVAALAPFIQKRTDGYTELLGRVVGFKEFLTLAEKDKLEMLLADNPQYYYDILPYANVLGVSDIWEKKFADLTVPQPTYWRGDTVFTVLYFNSFYRSSYRTFSTVSVSRPSSSSHSGGGFRGGGGGGFSGGGFGGGGGRSW